MPIVTHLPPPARTETLSPLFLNGTATKVTSSSENSGLFIAKRLSQVLARVQVLCSTSVPDSARTTRAATVPVQTWPVPRILGTELVGTVRCHGQGHGTLG